jgi:hypothetical protein
MLRAVLTRIRGAVPGVSVGDDGGDDDDDDGASRFVPSELDGSVRYAHGGSGDEIDRELADIEEEARRINEGSRRE